MGPTTPRGLPVVLTVAHMSFSQYSLYFKGFSYGPWLWALFLILAGSVPWPLFGRWYKKGKTYGFQIRYPY